ncbi:MAG TPA: hypothetical protein VN540_01540 [Clostridia bacterium]|nr:hypothetical protein [Clostridia bacterium]
MKRALYLLLAIAMVLSCIGGCVKVDETITPSPEPQATATPAPVVTEEPKPDIYDTTESVELRLSVFYQSGIGMKYTVGEGSGTPQAEYAAADGKIYREGDWKPVWAELQNRLNFTINDVTPTDARTVQAAFDTWEAQGFAGVDVMVGGVVDINQASVQNGTFLALDQYFDLMPNFSKFLEENQIVKTTITAGDGHVYFAPYFDGYDDIERMLMLRVDWVQKLLDDDAAVYDTDRVVDTYYTPYMPATLDTTVQAVKADGSGTQEIHVKYDKNIITIQNELAVKDGANLVQALKNYIDTTYAGVYAKRSDLFCGQDAAYNADELVALMRCVLANTQLLTGQSEYDAVPFYPRGYQAGRVQQVFSLMEIWGVRGEEARSNYFYVDAEGNLKDARFDDATVEGIERLNMLYKEGLILKDFDKDEATAGLDGSDHRARLNNANLGFMTYDYNQTTTVFNDTVSVEGYNLTPVLPPVADWDGNGNYYQFTASWRSVKTDGWAILANLAEDEAKLYRALALFDYQYSQEGNRLMSYGPEAWIDGEIEYNGKMVPKLSAAALTELKDLAKGNYTNYYRKWLGATLPIGYVKEQGMEYQTVADKGKVGLEYILRACELGTMKHLEPSLAEGEPLTLTMVPTTFALTAEEEQLIADNCADLIVAFRNGNNDTDRIIFTDYVIYGFGGTDANGNALYSKDGLVSYLYNDLNGKIFYACYLAAYARMIQ